MASVSPHCFKFCVTCKAENPERTKPADGCTKCKVTAWRCYWRNEKGKGRSQVFDGAKMANPKKAADAKKAEVESSQNQGTYVDPVGGKMLFATFAEDWAAAQDWKQTSRDRWAARLGQLTWALDDDVRLADIDQLALQKAKVKMGTRYASGTVAGAMHLLMAIMRSAVLNGKLGRDPGVGVDAAPKRRSDDTSGKVTPDMVPTRAEALALLANAPAGWRAAVALGLAGLRIGEVLGMRKDRLTLDERTVTVDAQAVELRGKGVVLTTVKNEKVRTIVVPQLVAMELRRHLRDGHGGRWVDADGQTHEMLFLHGGKPLRHGTFYELGWHRTLAGAGLGPVDDDGEPLGGPGRFKFHALRHHCASTLLAEGCPLPAVAGYLGDHQQTVLRVYAHWLPDDAGVPAGILDRVLAPEKPDASRLPHAVEGGGGS